MKNFPAIMVLILATAARPALATDAATDSLAKVRAEYPTPLCIVSGEHLEAGKIVEYVYKQPGKPDRLIRFCCHKCETRFKADPEKYLAKLDAASKAAKKN